MSRDKPYEYTVVEVDMGMLAEMIGAESRRRIRRKRLIDSGKMLQDTEAKAKHHMNIKGQPWEIVLESAYYYTFQDEGTRTIQANKLTPDAKDIKKMVQKLIKTKRTRRRRPRF